MLYLAFFSGLLHYGMLTSLGVESLDLFSHERDVIGRVPEFTEDQGNVMCSKLPSTFFLFAVPCPRYTHAQFNPSTIV